MQIDTLIYVAHFAHKIAVRLSVGKKSAINFKRRRALIFLTFTHWWSTHSEQTKKFHSIRSDGKK